MAEGKMAEGKMNSKEIDGQIVEAVFAALADRGFSDLDIAHIAERAGISANQLYLRAGGIIQLVCFALNWLDDKALAESDADFADAADASIYEKLLEGLIHRFEVFAPYKNGFSVLQSACMRRPDLAIAMICQLHQTVNRLLSLSGDDDIGWRRDMRVKGVAGVVMKTGSVWLKDDSADLSQTLNSVDKELRRAEDWAISLRLLEQSSSASTPDM